MYSPSITPTHAINTPISAMNNPLCRFIGSGSRDGCGTIPPLPPFSALGLPFWDLGFCF
jgi:hypothetical protein